MCSVPYAANLQPSRFPFRWFWRRHRDLQDAILKCRRGIFRLNAVGQRQATIEFAVAALAAIVTVALFSILVLAFALDGNAILSDLDFDVVFRQARKISAHDDLVLALKHFHLW